MKKQQLKKYAAITTASILTLQLAGCGGDSVTPTTLDNDSTTTVPKNNTEAQIMNVQNSDFAKECDEWNQAEDGSAQCIDEDSPYYAQHFFNGLMFASLGAMVGSSMYKASNPKKDKKRGGGGGGAVVVPPTSGAKNNTTNNSTTSGSSSSNGVNLNKNGSNASNDGKASNSSSNQGKSGSQVSPSNSGGKSGFSSGGGARGGSSGGS